MDKTKLINRIYEVEDECHDHLDNPGETTQETLYRLEDELSDLERDVEKLKKAINLYERLLELGLENRAEVSDFIAEYAKAFAKKNPDKPRDAYGYFEQAADHGGLRAKLEFARLLINGDYGFSYPEEGFDLLRRLAKEGSAEAAYLLFLLHQDHADQVDGGEAEEMLDLAASLGYGPASMLLGEDFDTSTKTQSLVERFNQGDRSVCFALSKQSDLPEEERQEFFRLALKEGNPEAHQEAGYQLKKAGETEQAKAHYRQAGKLGLPRCYLMAAELISATPHFYEAKKKAEIGKAQKEEFEDYTCAAAALIPEAISKMGIASLQGYLVKKDAKKAAKLFRLALRQGDLYEAPYLLGCLYEKGEGVKANATYAVRYYKRAADAGNIKAMGALVRIYERGAPGIEANPSLAARYRFQTGLNRQ